jgi:type I restriction enzyme S subunit
MFMSWKKMKLGEGLVDFIDGDRSHRYPKREEYCKKGIAFLNAESIKDGHVTLDKANYISEEIFNNIKKGRLQKEDLILTTRGNGVGNIAFFDKNNEALINAQLLILRPKLDLIFPKFLYYVLLSSNFQLSIQNFKSGSAQPQIPIKDLKYIVVKIPSLDIQFRIASILSPYDDLIENNTRCIKILEEVAQTIYKEWFVNFRFPGHEKVKFIDSPIGKIPEGWVIVELKEFGNIVTGKTPSTKISEYFGDEIPFIKTPDMHSNIFIYKTGQYLSKKGADSQSKKYIPPRSICVSCIGTVGVVSINSIISQTNQQINTIILNRKENLEYMFFVLSYMKEILEAYGSNGATMANVNKEKFASMTVVKPSANLIDKFHLLTQNIFDKIENLLFKNENLRKTRDLLLPKLMSGELEV